MKNIENRNSCEICKNNIPFSMPEEITKAVINNDLILFIGSGISTESKSVNPITLYEDVALELGFDVKKIDISFSELMSKYCKKNKGKKELLKKIKNRIDYIKSFQSLYNMATRFHRELSSIYFIKEIFTTNWDDFFEIECGAIPFVSSEDLAFWDLPSRKVFKIHGSINNVGSLIATKEDYKRCYEELKSHIIGNYLKVILATKLVLFIGYSFKDEDFNRLYSLLKKELGELMPHSYIVTVDDNISNSIDTNLITPIITDGTYFIQILKEELIKNGVLKDDSINHIAEYMLKRVRKAHDKVTSLFEISEYPNILYTCAYQDGIIDALQRFMRLGCTGDYHNRNRYYGLFNSYEKIRKDKIKIKKYDDVAYINGYISGLEILFFSEDKKMMKYFPLFYIYGYKEDITDFEHYKKIFKSKEIYHKSAFSLGEKLIKKYNLKYGIIYQHTSFIY